MSTTIRMTDVFGKRVLITRLQCSITTLDYLHANAMLVLWITTVFHVNIVNQEHSNFNTDLVHTGNVHLETFQQELEIQFVRTVLLIHIQKTTVNIFVVNVKMDLIQIYWERHVPVDQLSCHIISPLLWRGVWYVASFKMV